MPNTRLNPMRGFTLLELMVTLAIVSVLGFLTVPVLDVAIQRDKEHQLRTAVAEIRRAIDAYKRAVDEGDIEPVADGSGYPPNLDVLADGVQLREIKGKPRSSRVQKMFFLRKLPRDPMSDKPGLPAAATWGLRSYASEAGDPREGDDVFDVFSLSKKTGLNGIPYAKW